MLSAAPASLTAPVWDIPAVTITLCAQVILSYRINHGVPVIIVNDDTRARPPVVGCAQHRLRKRQRTFFFFIKCHFLPQSQVTHIHAGLEGKNNKSLNECFRLHLELLSYFLLSLLLLLTIKMTFCVKICI